MDASAWILRGIIVVGAAATMACDEVEVEPMPGELAARQGSLVAGMGLGDGESWAVSTYGEIVGWGRRYCDGDGCREPLELEPIALPGPAREVVANGRLTAARLRDGTVMGWGPTASDAEAPLPIAFAQPVAALAMGLDFLCARLEGGTVECRALPGEAGPAWLSAMPSLVDATALTAGAEHACALRSQGEVTCWGHDDRGQLGPDGGTGSTTITLSGSVEAVVAGGWHTCARLVTGEVECWGSSAEGQLGRPSPAAGPVTVPLPEPVAGIAMGAAHGCATGATSGSLYCWGRDAEGQLGAGTAVSSGIRRVDLGGLRATAVLAGATSSTTFAVLETGGLRGWGDDAHGQTGYGDRLRGDDERTRNVGDLPDIIVFIPPDEPDAP